MELTEKITKESDMPYATCSQVVHGIGGVSKQMPWWLRREWLRIEHKVYPEPSDIVVSINNRLPQFALHVSKEDPTLIAYTPDRHYGEADRQVRTTLGKFLTKYYPHFDDNSIRTCQEEHLADLDNSFEQLYGEDIVKAYRQLGVDKIGACMSYADSKYVGGNPTQAYDAPGISMAVLRDATGKITARSMLFCPSESDKRFIRVFLDDKLKKKLLRAGYKAGDWVGAKFKTISLGEDKYVLPYLDSNHGYGSDSGSTVAVIDGQLQGISLDTASRINNRFGANYTRLGTTTNGVVYVIPLDTSGNSHTCFLTGRVINWLTEEIKSYWTGTELADICVEAAYNLKLGRYNLSTVAYLPENSVTFKFNTVDYLDTEVNRLALGFLKLDPLIYPEEQDWKLDTRYHPVYIKSARDTWLVKNDSVQVYSKGSWVYEHASVIDKTYTRLHPKDGIKAYAESGEKIIRTVKGSKVVAHGYNVAQTYKGEWDFNRSVVCMSVLGYKFYRHRTEAVDTSPGSEMWFRGLEKMCVVQGFSQTVVSYCRDYCSGYTQVEEQPLYQHSASDIGFNNLKPMAGIFPSLEFAIKWAELKMAEAEALDYNLGPTATPDYSVPATFPSIEENRIARLGRLAAKQRAKDIETQLARVPVLAAAVRHTADAEQFIAAARSLIRN